MYSTKKSAWAWIISVLLLVGFLFNSISDYLVARNNVRATIAESTLPLTSDNVYSEIQRDLLQPIFIASLMAADTFLRDWVIDGEQDESAIVKYLNEIKVRYGTVTSFFISDKTRKYYYAHGLLKTIGEDDPRDAWYFRVRDMDAPYEINVDPDMANEDTLTIFINYRAKDYAGNFIGATGVGLTVNSVNNLISSYEAKFERQIYFVDQAGKIVLRPSNSPMLKYKSLDEIEGLSQEVDGLLSGETDSVSYKREGKRRIMNCRYVPELDWYLIVEQSEDAMLAPLRAQLRTNIISALAMTALVGGICILVVRSHKAGIEAQNRELIEKARIIEEQQQKLLQRAEEIECANEKLRFLNHEKDEFLSIVAHDLRNPLNSIIGFSELIQKDLEEGSENRMALEHIEKSGLEMLDLIQALLDVSKIEAFHGGLKMETIEWNPLLESGVDRFREDASKKRIALEVDISNSDGYRLESVSDWARVIVNNLLSNAIKYTPECGKVVIRTRLFEDRVETRVEDTGPGIRQDEQGRLFQKFARLSAKPTANENSTGLGLYIVKTMCDRLGIGIRVESEFGKGTAFVLVLKA